MTAGTLVIIDMQEIFRDPASQWSTQGYEEAAANVARLMDAHDGRIVWTRFVRDPREEGSWQPYYDRWAQCRLDADSEQWDITLPVSAADAIVTLPTFSKWGPQLAAQTAADERLVVCGVATDCCVLSTVLGAVDAGKRVTVVADACAGATEQAHAKALDLMAMLSPMVEVVTTGDLVATTAQLSPR